MVRYNSAGAFRAALDQRLRAEARSRQMPLTELRRQFVYSCYLARVFSLPDCQWVLKGGVGLLMRIEGARHSRDLDLSRPSNDVEMVEAIEELVIAGGPSDRDPFVFAVTAKSPLVGVATGRQMSVEARLGTTTYDTFPIDLTMAHPIVGLVEIQEMQMPLVIADVQAPPQVRIYPIADQVADKVAAMYQAYGQGEPSSRYRDLVDLVLIVTHLQLDPVDVTAALRVQALVRSMVLPDRMTSPGSAWSVQYAAQARTTHVPEEARTLQGALEYVGRYLDPVLAVVGTRSKAQD